MRTLGSPIEWRNLLDSLVPDILALIVATWEQMPSPEGDALEDPMSTTFCKRLRAGRTKHNLPFDVWTQLVELDSTADQEQGRMDIVFKPMVPREYIYFCLECKRLNVRSVSGTRPYAAEYVQFGMLRFMTGQYANAVRHGGMLGYVLDGNVATAIANVESNIRLRVTELGMELPGQFVNSHLIPDDQRLRETRHRRATGAEPFVIHHLFMPGRPDTPLRNNRPDVDSKSKPSRSRKRKGAA
jgi:hypothetical protein